MKTILSVWMLIILIGCSPSYQEKKTEPDTPITSDSNATIIETLPLYHTQHIGQIEDWTILSGMSCDSCDEARSLYVYSRDMNKDSLDKVKFSYPGNLHSPDTDSLIATSRVFWGNCLEKDEQVIIWVQEEQADSGWSKSYFTLNFSDSGLKEELVAEEFDSWEALKAQIDLGSCFEISPVDQVEAP